VSCLLTATDEAQHRASEGCAPHAAFVHLFEMRRFDFSNLATSGSDDITVVLQPALCVIDYSQVRLQVRVHALTMSGASPQTLQILAYGALPSDEDPAQDFVDQSTSFLRLDLTSSTPVPSLVTASGMDPDAYLRFVLYAQQANAAVTLRATLSAGVLLRK